MICLVEKALARITANGNEYVSSRAKTKHGIARLSVTPVDFLVSLTCSCGGAITWGFSDRLTAERWASLICLGETGDEFGVTRSASWIELSLPSGASWSQPWETVDQVGVLLLRTLEDGKLLVSFVEASGQVVSEPPAA